MNNKIQHIEKEKHYIVWPALNWRLYQIGVTLYHLATE